MKQEIQHSLTEEENAQIALTITVPSERVKEFYNNSLREVAKKAHIKGFRKGKVPTGVLEQKFKEVIEAESLEKVS